MFLLIACLPDFSSQPLGLSLQCGHTLFALSDVVARVPGQGKQMHRVPAPGLQLPLRSINLFGRRTCFVLPRLHFLPEFVSLAGCCLKEVFLLCSFFLDAGHLRSRLFQLCAFGRNAYL